MDSKRIGFGAIAVLAIAGVALSVAGCEDDPSFNPGVTLPEAGLFDAVAPDANRPDTGTDAGAPGGPIAVFGAMSFDESGWKSADRYCTWLRPKPSSN